MSTTAAVITIIAANAGLLFAALGLQAFWIGRSFEQIDGRLDRIDTRLDRIEGVLITFGERITRLEEHH